MKLKLLAFFAVAVVTLISAGCVNTVDGHMKAGVPFLNDKIESHYERPLRSVFQSAKEVLARNGTLQLEDLVGNALVAKIDTRTVYVRLTELNQQVTQVITQVRNRSGSADIDLASELDKQIALQLQAAGR